jgi:hypothetical protein
VRETPKPAAGDGRPWGNCSADRRNTPSITSPIAPVEKILSGVKLPTTDWQAPTAGIPSEYLTGDPIWDPEWAAPEPLSSGDGKVVELATRAQEIIEITELEPYYRQFPGKIINPDGSITPYPRVKLWWQSVACVPATIPHLFAYFHEARKHRICIIRGTPANPDRQPTLRQKAGVFGEEDRGDHGFLDEPTKLIPFDFDGVPIPWLADPEQAIRTLLTLLGEPWVSTSCVWFFSGTHGLEKDERGRWTGNIIDGSLRVRLVFIAERALIEQEAKELTQIARARGLKADTMICGTVQPNYIARPLWVGHPGCDPLGNIPTIGWIKGTNDYLAVPDGLTHKARWAKAQGRGGDIANHPDAESAVRGIGNDGSLYPHLKSAVYHLLKVNPATNVLSFIDHSRSIADKLQQIVEQHREEINHNLTTCKRSWAEVDAYLADIHRYAFWCLNHPTGRKTIRLSKQKLVEKTPSTREEIFARVTRNIELNGIKIAPAFLEAQSGGSLGDGITTGRKHRAPVKLLIAPTGSGKSTQALAAAVRYVTEHSGKSVVILVPRHQLGDEQVERLRREHPNGKYSAAVWRSRHARDPHSGDGQEIKMCQRSAEVKEGELTIVNIERGFCKRGRGKKAVKCPSYDDCAYQQQKRIKANIWFAAHECAIHEIQKTFGNVGWVIIDENPLDAFIFGTDINDRKLLPLDKLHTPLPINEDKLNWQYRTLMDAREELYDVLDKLQTAAVPRKALRPFVTTLLKGFEYPEFDKQGRRTEFPNYSLYYFDAQGNIIHLPPGPRRRYARQHRPK